jgi:predicted N-acetyltransferase YhbS
MPDNARPFKRAYTDEPGLRERVFDCLDEVFPGVRAHAREAAALGFRWEDVSTPFVRAEDGGRILAHVGVIEMEFVLEGKRVPVGVIHGVATRPDRRREGLYRSVMEAALRHADERTGTQVLCTAQPALYTPFGFRVLAEHRFIAGPPVSRERGRQARGRARPLLKDDPRDLARLAALLGDRAPVSHRLGVVNERVAFAFNELFRPLLYVEDLDAVVSLERDGGTLRVFDVVAREMPSLDQLIERLEGPDDADLRRIEIYFAPDRLGVEAAPEPWTMRDPEEAVGGEGDTILMARGPFPPEGRPFMLPRSARC